MVIVAPCLMALLSQLTLVRLTHPAVAILHQLAYLRNMYADSTGTETSEPASRMTKGTMVFTPTVQQLICDALFLQWTVVLTLS